MTGRRAQPYLLAPTWRVGVCVWLLFVCSPLQLHESRRSCSWRTSAVQAATCRKRALVAATGTRHNTKWEQRCAPEHMQAHACGRGPTKVQQGAQGTLLPACGAILTATENGPSHRSALQVTVHPIRTAAATAHAHRDDSNARTRKFRTLHSLP
jgi:hypothetical protein